MRPRPWSGAARRGAGGLRTAGHTQAWLTTGAGTRAERFYRRHGWRDMGRSLDGAGRVH
ncbi:hypothetical protein [Bosea vaviloviae]|uniref:hypothetical protein n=1 Tax=Bosea vaviloviae TaxID=1526658 RepID=UPI001FCDA764|nr:hypothetical protein [Bosea vaviloviae]